MAKSSTGNAQSIGTVKGLIGSATATDTSGVVRALQIGDKVFADDVIQTAAADTVQIEFENANFATVGHGSSLALDKTVSDPKPKSGADSGNEIVKTQAQIAAGADPTAVSDLTATGPTMYSTKVQ